MTSAFFQGFFLQASLILALGAQNIFVINSGLRRQRHYFVAFVCSICDAALILLGVLGVASVFIQVPILKIGFGVLGVAFLLAYGSLKLMEAKNGVKIEAEDKICTTLWQTLLTTLGFTLLNPHVYLDTIVLIGGYSTKFHELHDRFCFGLGAASFSVIWFFGLATLSSAGNRLMHNAFAMRMISLVSGAILIWLSVKLGLDVYHWIVLERQGV